MHRSIDILVLSDLHLGSFACRSKELSAYLDTIDPRLVLLAGDVIDITHGRPDRWPHGHLEVLRRLFGFSLRGVPVYYLVGNHDRAMRGCSGLRLGGLSIRDRLEFVYGGRRYLVLHGDRFDRPTGVLARVLHAIAGWGYDRLLTASLTIDRFLASLGRGPLRLVTGAKKHLPAVGRYGDCFRRRAAEAAAASSADAIICGHVHTPDDALVACGGQQIRYLNAGDWVEHCSALECRQGRWSLHRMEFAPGTAVQSPADTTERFAAMSQG